MLTAHAAEGLARLNDLLPLAARQAVLPVPLRDLHRSILRGFAGSGAPPNRDRLAALPGIADLDAALQELAALDLVVLEPGGTGVVGAYPFTLDERVHRVSVNGHSVFAMCALDALSVAPMFDVATRIDSACHVSGEPLVVDMQGAAVLGVQPVAPVVGIRWQSTSGCAAQSLCLEMVFLRDCATASGWQQQDPASISLFALDEAVAIGSAFFSPLTG